jgi:hypothetical protein
MNLQKKKQKESLYNSCYFIYFPISLFELSNAMFPQQVKWGLSKLGYGVLAFLNQFFIILFSELTFNMYFMQKYLKKVNFVFQKTKIWINYFYINHVLLVVETRGKFFFLQFFFWVFKCMIKDQYHHFIRPDSLKHFQFCLMWFWGPSYIYRLGPHLTWSATGHEFVKFNFEIFFSWSLLSVFFFKMTDHSSF